MVYLILWIIGFGACSCKSSIYQGAVTYKISRSTSNTPVKKTKIFFNERYIKVSTVRYFSVSNNLSALPGFHAFFLYDLLPIPIDPVLSLDEFYQVVKGISFEQFNPGELFPPYSSLKEGITTYPKIQSGIPKVIYYWETDHPLLYDNWLALQKVRTIYSSDRVDIITLARRKQSEKKTAQKWISELPLDAVHILHANNHIEKYTIRLLPVAVVIDADGKVVESVYSGNGQFEERLLSAIERTLKTQ